MKTKTQRHQTLAMLITAVGQVYLLDGASSGARTCSGGGELYLPLGKATEALTMLSCSLGRAGLRPA